MNIITLTPNPALDIHASARGFAPYRESVATVTSRDAGGKGVNVSRALAAHGEKSEALLLLGAESHAEFSALLARDGVAHTLIPTAGRVRENITLHEDGLPETRLSFYGDAVDKDSTEHIRAVLLPLVTRDTVLSLGGSLPQGMDKAALLALLQEAKEGGARLVLDSSSLTKEDILSLSPHLIKPNEAEAAALCGITPKTPREAAAAALALREAGVTNAMISLGAQGAVLACGGGVFHAEAPRVTPLSTVGAGDSSIAGFLLAEARGLSGDSALACAVAFGTAACLTEGTRPPRPEDTERLLTEVSVRRVIE